MFFPDKVRAYAEARRVLKPGGHSLFSVWDRIADNEFADVVTAALAEPRARRPGFHGSHAARLPRYREDRGGTEAGRLRLGSVDTVEHSAGQHRPAMSRSPTARARRSATRSTPVSRDGRGSDRFVAAALARRFGTGAIAGRMQAQSSPQPRLIGGPRLGILAPAAGGDRQAPLYARPQERSCPGYRERGAEGATAPETLRQKDCRREGTLESGGPDKRRRAAHRRSKPRLPPPGGAR